MESVQVGSLHGAALLRTEIGPERARAHETAVTLDMIIGEDLNIHVEATVARIINGHIGFAYARIPPEKEIPLWNLLGGYADRLEQFEA